MLNLKKLLTNMLNSQHKQFKTIEITISGTSIPANSVFQETYAINPPTGYTPICLRGYNLSRISGLCITRLTVTNTNVAIGGYNSASSQTLNGTFYILCVNNGLNN